VAAQNSERFRSRDSAIGLLPFRLKAARSAGADRANCPAANCRRRVAVNEGEPASQSFPVRQKPLASPLGHTRQTRCSARALSSCWTRLSPLIMHLRVHLRRIIIVAPPSDIAISHVPGAGVPGNGAAAIGIIEAVVARFLSGGQQSLAMLPDMILDLSAGHGEGIGGGCG
jgi:hypothetical protein